MKVNAVSMGNDPSLGDKEKIFGMNIAGETLNKAMAPDGMTSKSAGGIYDAVVDVASLPGVYTHTSLERNGAGSMDDDSGLVSAMATAITQATKGHGKRELFDPLWQQSKRHGLLKAKDKASFLKLIKEVNKSKKDVFENQFFLLQDYMIKRGYRSGDVDRYLQVGLLPRIIRDTYTYYVALLTTVRELLYGHDQSWKKGNAGTLLAFHSSKLQWIRKTSRSKRFLILRTYTYLRDSEAKNFMDMSMTESLWNEVHSIREGLAAQVASMIELKLTQSNAKTDAKQASQKACTHCGSIALHQHNTVGLSEDDCPLATYTATKAQALRQKILQEYHCDKSQSFASVMDKMVEEEA
jgi:hypothetical protein